MQPNHYILPALNTIVGYEQLSFLKTIRIEQWDLVTCCLDYYAKGMDVMYLAYWQSYMMVIKEELETPENYMEAKRIYDNIGTIRTECDRIYEYIRNTICAMLANRQIPSSHFNNIVGVSSGDNYFRVEIGYATL